MFKWKTKSKNGLVNLEMLGQDGSNHSTMSAEQAVRLALDLISAAAQVQSQALSDILSDAPLLDISEPDWKTGIDLDGRIVVALKTSDHLPPVRFRLRTERAEKLVMHINEMLADPASGAISKVHH